MRASLWLLVGCLFAAPATALEQVVLQLKWHHQFQFAGYYVAKEKGYFRDAGLDVEIRAASPELDVVEEVVSGRAQYGVGSSSLLLDWHEGAPVRVLGVLFQHSPFVILALQRPDLRTVHDLAGKHLMLEPQSEEIIAYLHHERVPTKDLVFESHSFDVEALIRDDVDATSAYITDEPGELARRGIAYTQFSPQSAGIDFYGDNLFSSEHELGQHPLRVQAFWDATRRGWRYAMEHPEEVIQLILDRYATPKDAYALRFEYQQMRGLMRPDLIEPGYMISGRWKHIANTYASLGMLPQGVEVKDFMYLPDEKPDLSRFYVPFAVLITVAGLFGLLAFYYARINRQLNQLLYFKSYHTNIGQAVATITHQWKQPLNELGTRLMRLQSLSGSQTPEQERAFDSCHDVIGHMADTIDTFSSFLRANPVKTSFAPAKVVSEVVQLFEGSLARHQIRLEIEVDEQVMLEGDPSALAHVLMVLLANARDILVERGTPQPCIHISVSALPQGVRLQVRDNGGGIRVWPVSSVFRLGFSRKLQQGAGLGLYVARQLVIERFGSDIRATNQDAGACFDIWLPSSTRED